jgi:hypothetical protein
MGPRPYDCTAKVRAGAETRPYGFGFTQRASVLRNALYLTSRRYKWYTEPLRNMFRIYFYAECGTFLQPGYVLRGTRIYLNTECGTFTLNAKVDRGLLWD